MISRERLKRSHHETLGRRTAAETNSGSMPPSRESSKRGSATPHADGNPSLARVRRCETLGGECSRRALAAAFRHNFAGATPADPTVRALPTQRGRVECLADFC